MSPRLGSKSIPCYAEFSEYLMALRTREQLLEKLSFVFIFSSGLRCDSRGREEEWTWERGAYDWTKNQTKLVLSSKRDRTDFGNVLQAIYCTKISHFSMGYNFKNRKNTFNSKYCSILMMKQQLHDKLNVRRFRKKSESQMGFEPTLISHLKC